MVRSKHCGSFLVTLLTLPWLLNWRCDCNCLNFFLCFMAVFSPFCHNMRSIFASCGREMCLNMFYSVLNPVGKYTRVLLWYPALEFGKSYSEIISSFSSTKKPGWRQERQVALASQDTQLCPLALPWEVILGNFAYSFRECSWPQVLPCYFLVYKA